MRAQSGGEAEGRGEASFLLGGIAQGLKKTEWEGDKENSGFQILGNRAHIYFYVYLMALNPGHSTVPAAESWKCSRTDNYCYLYY